ncbi:ArsR/SmtB family transcription factor [Actinoallomurus sp. CA-142502]|uniref:ArsR/SmtB family transcription factor n=1 Tax=Actinoallomurus sp. CA-142502 TaxID=3239885 RepID=UPI003D8DCA82
MSDWVDPRHPVTSAVTALARELADPIRLTALQLLAIEGPHTLSQLADALGVTAPRLGNHLARLRTAGLVEVEHTGRHAVYRAAAPGLGDVLTALSRYAHADPEAGPRRAGATADATRTCYDHLAGRLGVAVFGALVRRGALTDDGRSLGPDPTLFGELGVDLAAVDPGRRKLATACLDRTWRLPHLGGALGRSVLDAFLDQGLVAPVGGRDVTVTAAGAERLPVLLPGFTPS